MYEDAHPGAYGHRNGLKLVEPGHLRVSKGTGGLARLGRKLRFPASRLGPLAIAHPSDRRADLLGSKQSNAGPQTRASVRQLKSGGHWSSDDASETVSRETCRLPAEDGGNRIATFRHPAGRSRETVIWTARPGGLSPRSRPLTSSGCTAAVSCAACCGRCPDARRCGSGPGCSFHRHAG